MPKRGRDIDFDIMAAVLGQPCKQTRGTSRVNQWRRRWDPESHFEVFFDVKEGAFRWGYMEWERHFDDVHGKFSWEHFYQDNLFLEDYPQYK
jgi:hypothetical protein